MKFLHELTLVKAVIFLLASLVSNGTETFQGRLADVRQHDVTVVTKTIQCTFEVNDQTRITLDGELAELQDLPIGSRVAVVAEPGETDMLAKAIEAKTIY